MSSMTQEMSNTQRPGAKEANASAPKKGDRFRCQQCGMEIEVTTACNCKDADHVHFQCCGQELDKV